jgi:predicted negative regulator of RcsB-dependent stress response
MPQTLIVIFLLMFAVLAFGWFYWQRAKSRSTDPMATTSEPAQPAEPTDSTPAS